MNKMLLAVLMLAAAAFAKPPVNGLAPMTMAVEYTGAEREQAITKAEVPSEENLQLLSFYYAPVPLLMFSLGLGADRFKVSEYQNRVFEGGYGLTPAAGLYLSTPAFINERLRLDADFEVVYLKSHDDKGYEYSGPVMDPAVGLCLQLGPRNITLEAGARWHVISGSMVSDKYNLDLPFSNSDYPRSFLSLTAASAAGVYFQVDFAASSQAVDEHFKNGLKGASLGFKIGALLDRELSRSTTEEANPIFPEADNLKKRRDKMAEDIR